MDSKKAESKINSKTSNRVHSSQIRKGLAICLAVAGMLLYNWWVLVPFHPGLLKSLNELFSDLEASGQPYSSAMQHADLASGLLLLTSFLLLRVRKNQKDFKEWVAMIIFAIGGALGGIFAEACPDGLSAQCRRLEWTLQLPLHHYLHLIFGIIEFGSITVALAFAYQRTKGGSSISARIYKIFGKGAYVAYPLIGLAFILNVWGSLIEIVFFVSFTIIIILQLIQRIGRQEIMSTPNGDR